MTVHRDKFLMSENNRRTEFQFYWYYCSTCFGQPFCPSSGVRSRTSAMVHFCRFDELLLLGAGWKCSSILLLVAALHVSDNLSAHHQEFLAYIGIVIFLQIWWTFATRRRMKMQFHPAPGSYSTCFGQTFCPSSGVLSRTSALVYFCRFDELLLPGAGCKCSSILLLVATLHVSGNLSAHHQEFLAAHRHWYIFTDLMTICYQEWSRTRYRWP
jgi:hypothetical protein